LAKELGIMESHDLYDYKGRLEHVLKITRKAKTSNNNKQILIRYKDDYIANGFSIARAVRVSYDLLRLARLLEKDFDKADAEDMRKVMVKLEDEGISERTKYDFKVSVKRFYRWLRKSKTYPDEVEWIRPRFNERNHKLPKELLTEDDIKKLIQAADNPRDKAFVFTLYESGCRIGELLTLKIKNVDFDEYGAILLVDGKTGERRIRVISAANLITEWLNKHPLKKDHEALLWISKDYKRNTLSYRRIRDVLDNLKKKAKISKNVNPHNFRHSRATFLANHLTEAQMKEFFGWVQSSEMASVYVHLSGRDVDGALLKTYGLENKKKEQSSELRPIKCVRCEQINPPTNDFCQKCGIALNQEAKIEVIEKDIKRREADNILNKIISNKDTKELLLDLVKRAVKNNIED
jgi:site-specific recombinase XerD